MPGDSTKGSSPLMARADTWFAQDSFDIVHRRLDALPPPAQFFDLGLRQAQGLHQHRHLIFHDALARCFDLLFGMTAAIDGDFTFLPRFSSNSIERLSRSMM